MDRSEIASDELINDWLNDLEAAKNTRRNYINAMVEFTNYTGLTPEQLIESAEDEIASGLLMRKRSIKKHLVGFREMLKERGLAPTSVHNHVTGAKSFYRSNDVDLPNLNNKKSFRRKPLKKNDLRLEKDDIKITLKHANVRNRAIILTMSSSGLAQSDTLDMRVGAFKRGYDPDTGITTLYVRRIKTDYDFTTFLSPEAGKAILDWLDLRERKPKWEAGERRYEKHRVRSDNDYLFTKNVIPSSYLEDFDEEKRKLKPQGLMDALRRLATKVGMETELWQWSIIRAHNFRKFFNNTLLNAGADIFFVDYLMGHAIDPTHAAYYKADPVKLRERYMRYLPFLSIEDTEVKMIESPEYQELKAELEALKQQKTERQPYDGIIDDLMDDNEFLALLQKKVRERGIK